MATRAVKTSITQGGRTIYLTNKELLAAVVESKTKGRMSDTLAKMLQLLCARYAKKGNFVNYSYNEDMQAYAMMMLVRTWNSFNPEKSDNPFAFFTQCVKHSFIQYLNQERKQRDVRDILLIDQGLNPSYAYDNDTGDRLFEDEQDFDQLRTVAPVQPTAVEGPITRDEKGEEIGVDVDADDEPTEDVVQS